MEPIFLEGECAGMDKIWCRELFNHKRAPKSAFMEFGCQGEALEHDSSNVLYEYEEMSIIQKTYKIRAKVRNR